MRANDGRIERQLALRIWQLAHWLSSGLRSSGVVGAGGEIHVVMAGAACRGAGVGEPHVGLRRAVLGIVASLAAPRVRRVDHRRPVAHRVLANHLIRLSALDAGKLTAHVDLVDEDFHVQRIAGVRVGRLRLMAHDAKIDRSARPAMGGQSVGASGCGGAAVAVVAIGVRTTSRGAGVPPAGTKSNVVSA